MNYKPLRSAQPLRSNCLPCHKIVAKYESLNYPNASEIILRDFYVDDLLTGSDTTEEAIQLQKQISILLESGGFQLRKWLTNDANVLQQIPENHREISLPLQFDLDNTTKTLGMHYHPAGDEFQFKAQLPDVIIIRYIPII